MFHKIAITLLLVSGLCTATPCLAAPARKPAVKPVAPLSFQLDVLPVLARAGCSQAACHAKQGGKAGFQLSVFTFDPEADYQAVVHQAGGRRLNRLDPAQSLLLLKPTMALPHGGGLRFAPGSPEYRVLARWIAEGARWDRPGEPTLRRIEMQPAARVMAPGSRLSLRVMAHYSDGSRRDITGQADYRSNESGIAEVDAAGGVKSTGAAGQAAVMARYMSQIAVAEVLVPRAGRPAPGAFGSSDGFIDAAVSRQLRRLNIPASPPAEDDVYLRRVSLDLIGTLPTAGEVRAYLADCAAERARAGNTKAARARAVEALLARPEYADYWAMRWVNILLVDRDPLFPKGAWAYDRWVRDAFRTNMPYDAFARALVTATGDTYRDGPANFYRALASPEERGKAISQLFLGVRIDCAQCHHHPFERWSQADFYQFAAFFARVRTKYQSEFEWLIYPAAEGEVRHPKTQAVMPPQPLGGEAPTIAPDEDRREALARWLTAPENPFFARAIANRIWGMLMGRGLVEPSDDFRMTNPASNGGLLDALARDFVAHGYDLKHLFRTIVASEAYGRSSRALPGNARDTRAYSHAQVRRLTAEVLLDAVCQVTGRPEVYNGHPDGTRAIQLWDNKLPVEFLETFGRPSRLSVCECDRPADGSVTQVLHMMNGPGVQARLSAPGGTVARLTDGPDPPEKIVEELYLTAYGRFPRPDELRAATAIFAAPMANRRRAIEDLVWVLLNTPEFQLNH